MKKVDFLVTLYTPKFGVCSAQKGGREEITVDSCLCRTNQAGTASQFAALGPKRLFQLNVSLIGTTEMLPGADRLPTRLIEPTAGKILGKLVKT